MQQKARSICANFARLVTKILFSKIIYLFTIFLKEVLHPHAFFLHHRPQNSCKKKHEGLYCEGTKISKKTCKKKAAKKKAGGVFFYVDIL